MMRAAVTRRIAFVVTGRVQGVSYRASTQEVAERERLIGWVRNRRDGAVEGEAEGSDEAVTRLLAWLRHGPAGARVDDLHTDELDPRGGRSFEIRW